MSTRETPRIPTFTGRWFQPLEPRVEDVEILDIAHALANECRFTGHTRRFYSVAQHSVLTSLVATRAARRNELGNGYLRTVSLWGLLHDAPEAYLRDFPRPLKFGWPVIGEAYQQAEARVMAVVCQKFGLPLTMPAEVRETDDRLGTTEWRDLMAVPHEQSGYLADLLPFSINPWAPCAAEVEFLDRFYNIIAGRFE